MWLTVFGVLLLVLGFLLVYRCSNKYCDPLLAYGMFTAISGLMVILNPPHCGCGIWMLFGAVLMVAIAYLLLYPMSTKPDDLPSRMAFLFTMLGWCLFAVWVGLILEPFKDIQQFPH